MSGVGWVQLFEAWRQSQLSPAVAVAAGESSAADALDQEGAHFADQLPDRVSERRKQTFSLGRVAAGRAAAGLGYELADVAIGKGGAPVWPQGIVGSIAHTSSHGLALVGRAASVSALGIDIEHLAATSDIEWLVAFDAELDWVAAGDRDRRLLEVFSAKEAIFKAVYPSLGVRFGFDAVRLEAGGGAGDFLGRFVAPIAPGHQVDNGIEVWTRWVEDVVISWVVVQA